MKHFLEEYGLIIVSIIIVALLIWLIIFFGGRMSNDSSSMFGQFRESFDNGATGNVGDGGSLNNTTSALVKANILTYTGNPQELVKVFNSKGGTLLYRMSGSTYTETIPTGTDAGDYVVYYKIVGQDGTESEENAVDVRISKASANLTVTPTAKSLVYTGEDQELITAGNSTNGQLQYSADNINWSTSIPKGKDANTYTVYYKLDETANYNGITSKSISVHIDKADGTFTAPSAKTLTYNGLAQELVEGGSTTVGTLEYKLDGGSWGTAIPTATNAGNYVVYYRVEGNDNYNGISEQGINVVITKAGSTIATAPIAREITYNGTAQDLINPGSAEGGTIQYREGSGSYSELIPQGTDAGIYTVYYRVVGGDAYDDTAEQSITATISKADCKLTAPTVKSGLIYNGSDQVLINGGSVAGGTLQYRLNSSSYSTTVPSAKEAGTYIIYYRVVGDKNHNDIEERSLSVTIGRASGTITKPTAKTLTYIGEPQELVNPGSANGGTLQYRLNDGYYGENIPTGTDAGTYTVYYKVVGDDTHDDIAEQSLSVEIKKATPTVTAPVAESLTYTSYAQDLISDGTTTGGTLQYKVGSNGTYSTQIPQATDAGTYTVYYKVVGNKNYNDVAEKSLSVTIDKLVCNITKLPIAKGLVFNGTDQELIVAGTSFDGEMRYKLADGTYTATIPKKTDAGSYTVYYKVFGDSTHKDSDEKTITAKIEKADLHLVPPSETRLAYTGTNQPIVQEGYSSEGTIYYKLGANGTYSTSVPQAKDMGTYTVYYKVIGDKNHKDVPETALTSIINGGMATYLKLPEANDLTYNRNAQALVSAGTANGGEVQYKLGANGTYSTSIPTGTNAGLYTVFYKIKADENHDDAIETSIQVRIKKANPVVSVTAKTLTYNTSAQALVTGTTDGGTLQYKLGTGSYSTTIPSATNAGTYTVYYKVIGDSNYNDVGERSVSVTINKRVPTVTAPTAKTLTYNTASQTLIYAGSTNGGTLQYKLDSGSYSTTLPSATNAGTYTVYYKVVGDSNHTDVAEKSISVTINKRVPTVTAPTAKTGLIYNTSAQTLINAGGTNGGTLQYKLDSGSYGTGLPSATNAGTYTVYYKVVGDSNHTDVAEKNISVIISKRTPTVTAPTAKTGLIYNTSAQTLITAGSTNGGTLQYKLDSGNYGTGLPSATNAGTYTVYYKVVGDSNHNDVAEKSISVTISKRTPTVNAPTAKSLTYTGNAQTLINAGSTNGGTLQYKLNSNGTYGTGLPSATNAGTYTVYYKVVGDSNHNDVAEKSISVTINKAAGSVTAPTAKTGLIYNTSAQTLINAGSSSTGTIQYKLGSGSYSTTLPSATNAGTYTVYYKVVGDSNHNDVAEKSISVTIAKRTPTVTAPTAKSLTYNGSAQTLITAGSTNGGTLQYKLDSGSYGTGLPSATNAGTYTVYYKVVEDSNHNAVAEKSISVTINKRTPTVNAPTAKSLTYTGNAQTLINAGSTNGGTLQYKLGSGSYGTGLPSATNAGTYTVYYKVVEDSNHNAVAEKSISVTINKATGSVTAPTAKSLTYNGSAQTLINTGSSSTGTIQYKLGSGSYGTGLPSATNAGTYTVYYKVVGDGNHTDVAEKSISVTISKRTPTVTAPTAKSLTYNGSAQTLINAGSTNGGTLQYKLNSGSYGTGLPSATNAGTYTVYYKVVEDSNHNAVAEKSISVTINKAAGSVTAPTAKSLTYNGSAQTLINAGSSSTGTIKYKLEGGSYGTGLPSATSAGTYKVYYMVEGDSNHNNVAENYINVTISKRTPTVTAPTAKSLTYNGSAQTLINAGSTTSGTLQYKLNSGSYGTGLPSATNAGTYTVYYKVVGDGNNNDVAEKSISVTINKAQALKTAPTAKTGLVYNGSAQALLNAGAVNNGTMYYKVGSGSYGTSLPTGTNAGSYDVYYKVTPSDTTNYAEKTETKITVSIGKASGSVTAPTAKTGLRYNGSAQTLINAGSSSTGTIQYKLNSGSYATTLPTGTSAGTYTVYYKVVGNSNYNDVAEKSISVTIGKRTPTVTAPTAKTGLVYNGSAQTLINVGSTNGGTIQYKLDSGSYSTTLPSATNAGTYTVYYKVVGDGNNNDVVEKSISVTISKRTPTVTAPTAKSLTYNGSNQTLINAGSTSGGSLQYKLGSGTYSTTLPSALNSGTYTVFYKVVGDGNNNDIAEKSITVTINLDSNTYRINVGAVALNPTWTGSGTTGYMGSTSATTTTSQYGYKRIRYTKPDGTVGYVSPFETSTIYIKKGTALVAEMYAGNTTSPSSMFWTLGAGNSDATSYINNVTSNSGKLFSCDYIPTGNSNLNLDYDTYSSGTYGWHIGLSALVDSGYNLITFNSNGGKVGCSMTRFATVKTGQTMPTIYVAPVKSGYVFDGYWDATSGGTKYYNADLSSARTWDKSANTTLYAHWRANQYTVTVNKGTGISSVSGGGTYTVGSTVTVSCTLSSSCYKFSSWTGTKTGTTQSLSFVMPESSVTVTANGAIITDNNAVHSFKAVDVKAATCTASGTKQNKCERCGYTLPDLMTVPALGHSFTEWESTNGGYACTTSGKKTRHCTRCNTVESQTVAALGHSYVVDYYYCNSCGTHFSSIPSSHSDGGTIYVRKKCVYGCGTYVDSIAAPLSLASKFNADSANFDITATINGSTVYTTFPNSNPTGYSSHIKVGSSTSTMQHGTIGDTLDGVTFKRFVTVDDQNRFTITYQITNTTSSQKTVGCGFDADTMVNGNDSAPITANNKGFTITGNNNVTFQVYTQNTDGVDNVDGYWYGKYSGRSSQHWTTSKTTGTFSGDSGFTFNWQNRIVPANSTITLTVKMGLI